MRREADFKRANALAVISAGKRPSHLASDRPESREERFRKSIHSPGELPAFLVAEKKRKAAHHQDKTKRSGVTPGFVAMPDGERVETLKRLLDNKQQVLAQLARLPPHRDIPSVRQAQLRLESKLDEIEDAIKLFSKSRVYIKKDE